MGFLEGRAHLPSQEHNKVGGQVPDVQTDSTGPGLSAKRTPVQQSGEDASTPLCPIVTDPVLRCSVTVFEGSALVRHLVHRKRVVGFCCKQSALDRMESCPSLVVKEERSENVPWPPSDWNRREAKQPNLSAGLARCVPAIHVAFCKFRC